MYSYSKKIIYTFALVLIVFTAGCVPKTDNLQTMQNINIEQSAKQLNIDSLLENNTSNIWSAYNNKQLDSLISSALKESPDIKIAEIRIKKANENFNLTLAKEMPQIDANGAWGKERFSANYIFPPPFGGSYYPLYSVGATLNYEFDFWGKTAAMVESAKELEFAQKESLRQTKLILISSIISTYINWYYAEKKLANLTKILALQNEILKIVNAKYKNDLIDETALNKQKAEIIKTKQSIIFEQIAITALKQNICILANKKPDYNLTMPQINENAQILLPKDIYLDYLANRPDIALQKHIIESKSANIKSAKAAFYPNINLSTLVGLISLNWVQFLNQTSYAPSVTLAGSLPLFDGGARAANLNYATDDYNEAIYVYNSLVIKSANEIILYLKEIQELDKAIITNNEDLVVKNANSTIEQKKFKAGLIDKITIYETEIAKQVCEIDLIDIKRQKETTKISLMHSLGGGKF